MNELFQRDFGGIDDLAGTDKLDALNDHFLPRFDPRLEHAQTLVDIDGAYLGDPYRVTGINDEDARAFLALDDGLLGDDDSVLILADRDVGLDILTGEDRPVGVRYLRAHQERRRGGIDVVVDENHLAWVWVSVFALDGHVDGQALRLRQEGARIREIAGRRKEVETHRMELLDRDELGLSRVADQVADLHLELADPSVDRG